MHIQETVEDLVASKDWKTSQTTPTSYGLKNIFASNIKEKTVKAIFRLPHNYKKTNCTFYGTFFMVSLNIKSRTDYTQAKRSSLAKTPSKLH